MGKGKRLAQQKNRPSTTTTTVAVHQQFSGPIPPPDALERYERIQPGFANRIMTMAETQSQHRQGIERAVVDANIRHEGRGQVFGLIIALSVIGVSAWLLWHGKSIEGLTGMLGTVVTLAAVFVYGRWRKDRELAQKNQRQLGG